MQTQRGRRSFAATITTPIVDVRAGRPEPPVDFGPAEKELWQHIVYSRRPGWFNGCETLLQSFVVSSIQAQAIEVKLRKATPDAHARYERLARLHRQTITQCNALARALRLAVSTRVDKNVRHDGDQPLADAGASIDDRRPQLYTIPVTATGERRFSDLRRQRDAAADPVTDNHEHAGPTEKSSDVNTLADTAPTHATPAPEEKGDVGASH